jgi:hypothetical protein
MEEFTEKTLSEFICVHLRLIFTAERKIAAG